MSPNPRQLPETVQVGRVLRPHGLRGDVKVEVTSDVPDRFSPGQKLLLTLPGRPPELAEILASRPLRGGMVVQLAGITDRARAETLRGAVLEVKRSAVPKAPAGSYYFFELVGCCCIDAVLGELGEVVDVIEDGGGVLLAVRSGAREVLVPFVDAYLVAVDVDRGQIDLQLPEGLIEACTSSS